MLFFSRGVTYKRYEVSKFGGGGVVVKEEFITFQIFLMHFNTHYINIMIESLVVVYICVQFVQIYGINNLSSAPLHYYCYFMVGSVLSCD